jgi:signal transduction histidine kinase
MDLDELLEGVLERATRAIEADAASILIEDAGTGELAFRAAVGGESRAVKRQKLQAGAGIAGWVAKHGQPQIVNDVALDARFADIGARIGYRPRSVLCVPLTWDGGVGALEFLNKRSGESPFTEDDVKLATVIAQNIASAIQTAESRTKQRRQERLSTIGHFLSGVLHDLKSPMTVISGYVRVMASEDDRSKRELLADKVLRQVHMLNTMTRETLAFARGERRLWVRRVYLYKFFEELEETLGPVLEERGVHLEVELRDRGTALFDEEKMIRVMHNLVRNAADAVGERGGTVHVVVDRGADGGLCVDVIDDGPGIPVEVRGRLFESFTTAGKKKGTGLGLAIVKSIIDDHRGKISVDSRPGRTVFSISIPPMQPSDETDVSLVARP